MSRNSCAILTAGSVLLFASAAHAQSGDQKPAEAGDHSNQADSSAPPPAKPSDSSVAPPAKEPDSSTPPAKQPVDQSFERPAFVLTAGPKADWKLTIYGFAEGDMMRDSTRSFNDGINSNVVAHELTQAYDNPRLQFTIRNSRVGFKAQTPPFAGIRTSGVLEFDLFGNQPSINSGGGSSGQAPGNGTTTEAAYFNNAAFRVRHAYVKIEDDVVDVMAGQGYHLLGWQNYFFPATCAFLGVPNMMFNRTGQVRLSHTFKSDPINIDVAVAAFRPAQRDSGLPDGEGGIRLAVNHWKAMTTPGSGGTGALPAGIGVSGLVRQFKVDPYAPLRAPTVPLTGWALAGDVLLPIIPAADSAHRGNALTVTGEFVTGTGDADQYTGMTAGATMPNAQPLPPNTPLNGMGIVSAPVGAAPLVGLPYTPNVDPGLVALDLRGAYHTINWRTLVVGLQYYLPPDGRFFISGIYSRGESSNIQSLYHPDSSLRYPWINTNGVFHSSWYADGNIFFDVTPSTRIGLSYQYLEQGLADGTTVHNHRVETTFLYFL
jgi:hypothetical protein